MTYRLRETTYIDLGKHAGPYRYKHGWIKLDHSGNPLPKIPVGKHEPGSPDLEARSLDIKGQTVDDHLKRLDELMKRVQTNEGSLTVDEEAWSEAADRLDALTQIARTKSEHLAVEKRQMIRAATKGAAVGGISYALKNHLPRKVVGVAKEYINETSGAARDSVIQHATVIGSNFAASAASLIGAQQAAHFVEAFHRLLENPAIEVGFTAAAAVLLSALISAIRKALQKHKDRKIAKARGDVISGGDTLTRSKR